jgi:hypothetical protein
MVKYIVLLIGLTAFWSGGERYVEWKQGEKLTWDDFQGPADYANEMQAHTTSRINYNWQCDGGMFMAEVESVFDREKSWKKDLETDALLAHEQLHFDLTEVWARQLRKAFSILEDPCSLSPEEIKEIADQVRGQWQAEQKLYDLRTDHGRDAEWQLSYGVIVKGQLEELQEFALE